MAAVDFALPWWVACAGFASTGIVAALSMHEPSRGTPTGASLAPRPSSIWTCVSAPGEIWIEGVWPDATAPPTLAVATTTPVCTAVNVVDAPLVCENVAFVESLSDHAAPVTSPR